MFGMMFWCFVLNMFGVSWVGGGVKDTVLVLARGSGILFIGISFPGTSTWFSKFKLRCLILFSLSILGFLFAYSILVFSLCTCGDGIG